MPLGSKKTDVVLDAGCGPGYGAVFLSEFAGRVVGGDGMRNWCGVIGRFTVRCPISALKINLLDRELSCDPFDAVVSMDVIEHFSEEQADGVVANYARLTKDDGFALIGTLTSPHGNMHRNGDWIHILKNMIPMNLLPC